jgi:serine phosphatase RsbU (regulator of sigma subunit)/PAS domain-containing protein
VAEDRTATAGLLVSLTLVAGLTAVDALSGASRVVTATIVLGPFLASLLCTLRQTIFVAVVTIVVAAFSGLWMDGGGSLIHGVRQLVVFAGAGVSVIAAHRRARVSAARRRLRLLVELGEASNGAFSPRQAAERIVDLLVPAVGEACTIDVVRDGTVERLTGIGEVTTVQVPLRSRGAKVGTIAFGGTGKADGRPVEENANYLQAIADRVALALDNAGLSSDLAEAERRLGVALDAMAGAVLIQRPGRGIVYANQAAADSMGLPTAAAVMAATPEQIAQDWDSTLEDGTPLTPDMYPSRKILTGTDLHPDPLVVRGLHRETGRELWSVVRATAVLDEDGAVVMAVSISEDITSIKRAELLQRLLADTGEALASSLDADVMLQAMAEVLVTEFVEWAMVNVPAPAGGIRLVAVANRDPGVVRATWEHARRDPGRTDGTTGAARVLRGEGPLLIEMRESGRAEHLLDQERVALLRQIGLRSVIHVPIAPPSGPPLGALTLASRAATRVLTTDDLQIAEELGRRAGVALQTALLYDERSRVAATLQDSLLPEQLPSVKGFRLAVTYRPAARDAWVGGDFYDVFPTPGGWMAVVGDVAGQGAEAAALTAQARHTLRSAGTLTGDPVKAVTHLNEMLVARSQLSMCTVCIVLLPEVGRAAQVVCAGHPLPVRVRDDTAEEVGAWGVMVGAYADATFAGAEVVLEPDDLLVLYTDGVIDARSDAGRFGDARLRATLRGARDPEDAVARVDLALEAFQTGDQADDTAMLVIGRAPAGALRPAAPSPAAPPASPAAPPAR